MPNNVDTRIVEMEFDNAQFERGAKQTLKTLDELNKSIRFDDVEDKFSSISAAASKVDFSGITNGIETVQASMGAFQAFSFGIFEKLGNKVADLGTKMANELFVAQKKAGFAEYELELGSVQTINASTGKSFEEIYGYLAELNKYADQTIYSFRDMTSSIGKFTNAGVELDTAVAAIQGISNEAAVSGANAEEASRAMYNFAQALSAGYVKLIDWKSIENANMATVEFKQQLIDTAVALGTVKKQGDKYVSTTTNAKGAVSDIFDATSNFNDSLQNQWMTTEVLTTTLSKYADSTSDIGKKAFAAAQDVKSFSQLIDTLKEAIGSGWSETFRIIIGEFEDAKTLWTGVSNVLSNLIDRFSNFRNHMLRYWKQEGGRTKTLKSLLRLWKIFAERVKIVAYWFNVYYPILNKMGHVLMNFTNRFTKFTKQLKRDMLDNSESLEKFKMKALSFVNAVHNIVGILTDVGKAAFKIVKTVFAALFDQFEESDTVGWFGQIVADAREIISSFLDWVTAADKLESVYNVTKSIVQVIGDLVVAIDNLAFLAWQIFGEAGAAFNEVFGIATGKTITNLSKSIRNFTESLVDGFMNSERGAKNFRAVFKVVFKIVKLGITIIKALTNALAKVFNVTAKKGTPAFARFFDIIGDLLDRLINFLTESNLIEKAILGIAAVFKGINDFIKGLTGKSVLEHLSAIFDFFIKMGKKVDFGAIGKKVRRTVDGIVDKLQYLWTNVLHLGDETTGPAKLVNNFDTLKERIDKAGGGIEGFGKVVKDKFTDMRDVVKEKIDNIISFLEKLLRTCKLIAKGIKKVIGGLGTSVAEGIVSIVTGIVDEKTLKKIEESETFIGDAWNKLKEIAELNDKGLGKKGKSLSMDNLNDKLKELYDGLKKSVWLIDLITDVIFKLQIGKAALNFANGIKNIGTSVNNMSIGFKMLSDSFGVAAKRFMRYKQIEAIGALIVSISAAFLTVFAIIVGLTAIFTFGNEDVKKRFIIASSVMLAVIVAISIALIAMLKALSNASKANANFVDVVNAFARMLFGIAAVLAGFAIAIGVLAHVYEKLGGYDYSIVLGSLGAFMIVVFALLGYMIKILSDNDNIKYGVFNIADTFSALSKMLLALGASLILMSIAMQIIARVPEDSFWKAFAVIFAFYAMLLALLSVLIKTPSSQTSSVLEGLSKVVTAMGKAMILLAIALGIMTTIFKSSSSSSVWQAFAVVFVFMTVMGAMVVLATKFANPSSIAAIESIGNMFTKVGNAMVLMAVAVGIIAYVTNLLKKNDIDAKYFKMLGSILIIMGVVLAALALLTKLVPGGAVTYILIAAAFVVLAVAIGVLAASLKLLEQVDFDKLADGFSALGHNAHWIAAVAGSMLLLGVGALALAVGLIALWAPLALLWPIFKEMINYFPDIQKMFDGTAKGADKLDSSLANTSLGTNLGAKIGEGLRDFVKSIKKYAPEIIKDVSDIMALVVEGFFAPLQGIGKGFIDVTVASLGYINEHLDDILTPLGKIIDQINTWIKDYAPKIAETVALVLFYIFNGAFVVLAAYADILAENLYEAFASLLEAFGDQLTGEKNARVAAAIAKIVDGLLDLIKKTFKALSQTEMAEAGANLIEAMVEGIKAVPNKIKKALNEALGVEFFDVGEDLDMSMHAGEMGWRVENGDWIYDEELAAIQKEQEEAQKAIERAEGLKKDLAGGGGSSTTVNSIYDTKQMENSNKKAAELADEALGTVEDTKKELEKESKKADKTSTNLFGNLGLGEITDNLDMDSLKGKLSEIFNVKDMLPSSEDMTAGFSDMFGGMPDMNSIVADSGFDTSIDCAPVLNMDNAQVMQDGTLSDLSNFDTNEMFNVSGTTDISQSTASSVSAQLDDETSQLLKDTKKTLQELRDMMDNVTIVSNEAKLSTSLDVDGETLGTAVVPFVDAALSGSAGKAKNKVAQTYKKIKSR